MKTLENIYVVIYSRTMLNEAIRILSDLGYKFETNFESDFESDNYRLRYRNNYLGLIHFSKGHEQEVTLNEFVEIAKNTKPKELDVGKWYLASDNHRKTKLLVNYQGKEEDFNYGIDFNGNWQFDLSVYHKNLGICTVEATHHEVEEALIKEAKKRGFGIGAIINHGHLLESYDDCNYQINSDKGFKFQPGDNSLWLGGISIFKDGKWAEIVQMDSHGDIIAKGSFGASALKSRIKSETKVKMGDYVITELKNQPSTGFSTYQLSIQNSVDVLNSEDTLYNFKIISKEKFEELRKEAFGCTTS